MGRWDERGRLFIIDRKKNIFKLSQGEYIAPERIENVLIKSRYIAQAFVYGDSLENCLVAVVVPDEEAVKGWAAEHVPGYSSKDANADVQLLYTNPAVTALFAKEIEAFGKTGSKDLSGFELPRAIYLEPSLFSVENGILTATFKTRRNEATRIYSDELKRLYSAAKKQVSSTVAVLTAVGAGEQ